MQFPAVCPEVPVGDLAAALAYYRDRLGFTVDWSDEALGLAGVSRGRSRLFLGNAAFRAHLGTSAAPVVLWLNLANRDEVDALHAQWRAAGASLDAPPDAKPYGLYEFLAFDLDRNILRVFYDFGGDAA